MFNVQRLQRLMYQTFPQLKSFQNKAIVLVIGASGAGKSTLVDALLGVQFKKGRGGRAESILPNPPAAIGNGIEIGTRYPVIYESSDGINYCDCPGLEQQVDEESVCASFAMETAVRISKHISSIIIVIDYFSLAGRAETFKKICETLSRFFKSPEAISHSVYFVITKAPADIKLDDISERITELMKQEEETLPRYKDELRKYSEKIEKGIYDETKLQPLCLQMEKSWRLCHILKWMQQAVIKNVFLVNVFDEKSVQELKSTIKRTTLTVDKKHFDFESYSMSRQEFNQAIATSTQEAVALFTKKEELLFQLQETKEENAKIQERIQFYRDQMTITYQQISNQIQKPVLIQQHENMIQKNQKEIKRIVVQLANLNSRQTELDKSIKDLDQETPILHWKRSITKNNTNTTGFLHFFTTLFGGNEIVSGLEALVNWADSGKEFYYKGVPFLHADRNCTAGKFFNEHSYPELGEYSVTYKGEYSGVREATVSIFVAKKNVPSNKFIIDENKIQLKEISNNIYQLNISLEKLKIEIKTLESILIDIKTNNNDALVSSENITVLSQTVSELEAYLLVLMGKNKNISEELGRVEELLVNHKDFYEVIYNILQLLDEETIPIKQTFLKYTKNLFEFKSSLLATETVAVLKTTGIFSRSKQGDNPAMPLEDLVKKITGLKVQISSLQQELTVLESEYLERINAKDSITL